MYFKKKLWRLLSVLSTLLLVILPISGCDYSFSAESNTETGTYTCLLYTSLLSDNGLIITFRNLFCTGMNGSYCLLYFLKMFYKMKAILVIGKNLLTSFNQIICSLSADASKNCNLCWRQIILNILSIYLFLVLREQFTIKIKK